MKSFRDLKVWEEASKLSKDISTKLVPLFPKEEKFRLGNQIIRSSRCSPSQIAEGFRKSSLKEKNHYYEMALTSNDETENHLIEAKNNDFISVKTYKSYLNRVIRIRILLSRLIKSVNRIRGKKDSKTIHRR
jgi:four helix bundle protein